MRTAFLRSIILLALPSAATAQTEPFFATGVDSTGWAQAQSNADGHVLIESPQYPRGLWLHLVDEAGEALAGIQVKYQGRPDSLVAIHCVDPVGGVQEMLVWTRAEGDPLRLILKPKEATDLPTGLAAIDWQIDASAESLLELEEETRLEGWEAVAVFLRERWQDQAGRIAVQLDASTNLAVEVHPEAIEMLAIYLQQQVKTSLEESTFLNLQSALLKVQVFSGALALLEGVSLSTFLFEDAELEATIRQILGRPQGFITLQEAASLNKFEARSSDIHSLVGIEHFTALQELDLYDNHLADVTPLAQLTNLQELGLGNNQITDVAPLAQLTNLQWLSLSDNHLADVAPLAQLTNLQELELRDNQITDVTPLAQLTNLQDLALSYNHLADITPLAQLTNLQELGLGDNQITDVTPLSQLTNLQELYLYKNRLADVNPLAQLTNLKKLVLFDNLLVDVTPLAQLTNLPFLSLSDNHLADITPLAQLTNLQWLGLTDNQIADVNPLAQLTNLQWLFLYRNQLVDITPLAHLTNLQGLRLQYNQIEDITPLLANTGLGEGDEVRLEGNPLSDQAINEHIPALEARGVEVIFY